MRTCQPAEQSVTGARYGGQVSALAALPRHRTRAALHEHGHPPAYRTLPQGVEPSLRRRNSTFAHTVATCATGARLPAPVCKGFARQLIMFTTYRSTMRPAMSLPWSMRSIIEPVMATIATIA